MKNIKFNKKTYIAENTREELDENFTEFKIKTPTIKEFFVHYDNLFYEFPKKGRLSHSTISNKSIKYVGMPPNPKLEEIQDLIAQLKRIQRNIDSIELEHDLIPNRTVVQSRNNPELKYYMQSGRKRPINKSSIFKLIKRQRGAHKLSNNDFVILLDQSAIEGITEGLPIDKESDLNVSILEINRNMIENINE